MRMKSQSTNKKNNRSERTGLTFERHFTKNNQSPYDQFKYEKRSSVIRNPAGDVVFEMNDVEVPEAWSQVATDILAQKYFRRTGVPQPDGTTAVSNRLNRWFTALPTAGHSGVRKPTTLLLTKMHRYFMMRQYICCQVSMLHQTHHNGSTQDFIQPIILKVQVKDTGFIILKQKSWKKQTLLMSVRNLMPALSFR